MRAPRPFPDLRSCLHMAVCFKARLVQSHFGAAGKRTRYSRLVLGQGRAQGRATLCQGRWRTRSRTRTHKDAQGGAQGHGPPSAHKVKKAKPRSRFRYTAPGRKRTRCAQGLSACGLGTRIWANSWTHLESENWDKKRKSQDSRTEKCHFSSYVSTVKKDNECFMCFSCFF